MVRKKDEEWFYEHGGYGYDQKTETPEQGRRRMARELAKAEEWARKEGYDFKWEAEEEAWSTFIDDTEVDVDDVSEIVYVVMRNDEGESVQGLGGVIEGHDDGANRNYRRIVEAELALDQMAGLGLDPMQDITDSLRFINLHRARMGQRPLDPVASGWEPEDIAAEARRIRGHNPRPRVSLFEAAATVVLTGAGVVGIVLGRRKR